MESAADPCLPVPGISLAAAAAGLYDAPRDDLALLALAPSSISAAVFTSNKFQAAPVIIARERISKMQPKYLLINAGNANAGTGARGLDDARRICRALARRVDADMDAVLPFSTGVIGEYLPVDRIIARFADLVKGLGDNNWRACAQAIMTTDRRAKYCSRQLGIDGRAVTITGIAKGAGMIRPDMATMLAFICTDAQVSPACLQTVLTSSVDHSFNSICVDGDTSSNDACVLTATGLAANVELQATHPQYGSFAAAVAQVCQTLAQAIIKDAEGATKFVTVRVVSGRCEQECKDLALLLATSPLIKTALYASDPNWGRILAAVGRAAIADLDIERVQIYLGDTCVVEDGARSPGYTEEQGQAIMQCKEISLTVVLRRGSAAWQLWTCDLSHEYVTINAEYRT